MGMDTVEKDMQVIFDTTSIARVRKEDVEVPGRRLG